MKTYTQDQFSLLIEQSAIKPRLKKELKFVSSTSQLPNDWSDFELIAIADRTGSKGVLLLQPDTELYIASYELTRRIVDSQTGRERAVICDFCYTWQPGSNAATITFLQAGSSTHSIGYLCCADLACSEHVRTKTKASIVSRARLRENITGEDRIERLKTKLRAKIQQLVLVPIEIA